MDIINKLNQNLKLDLINQNLKNCLKEIKKINKKYKKVLEK
jgi:hypothetical protein